MIEEHYGRYIGDEGDAVLEAYLKAYLKAKAGPKAGPKVEDSSNYRENMASLTPPSWNQLVSWARELDLVRKEVAA